MNWKRTTPRLLVVVVALVTVTGMLAAPGVVAAQEDGPPQPPQRYYGTVENADGNPASGVTVEVSQGGDVVASDTTDGDGYYDLQVNVSDVDTSETVTISAGDQSAEADVESGGSTQVDLSGVETEEPPVDDPTDSGEGDVGDDNSATVDLSGGDGSVGEVSVSGLPAEASTVTVYESDAPTDGAPEPDSHTVAVYLDIGADVDVTDDVEVTVTVDASVLEDAGIATDDAELLHHTDGDWQELGADVSTAGDDVTLTATASGLSPFAVGQADDDSTDGSTPTEAPGGGGNTGGNTGGQTGGSDGTPTATPTDEPSTPTDTASTPTDEPSTPTDEPAPETDEPTTGTDESGTDSGPGTLIVAGGALALLTIVGGLYVAYRRD